MWTALASPVAAQMALPESTLVRTIETPVAPHYRAGALHRLVLGSGYRNLWTTPVRVQVLDVHTFAGGLRATQAGKQTRSLRFIGANGREYVLRSADKIAAFTVAPELRGTLLEALIQDQVSASHPFSAAVADHLEEAVGLPPLHPVLVLLPDDSALGEFRGEYAGMLGYVQDRPEEGPDRSPGFGGFRRVIGTDALLRRRRERPEERVDVRGFLTARVLDLLLGDWDRHRDQWRWGRVHADSAWQPVPRDHDWAFGRYDGLVLAYLRHGPLPHLVHFDAGRLPVPGLTWFGRDLDRELLPRLEWAVWDSVVAEVSARVTDSVLAAAVEAMPAGVPEGHRTWLAATLRARREQLPDAALRFYRTLAREADLHATDAPEHILVEGMPHGAVWITVAGGGVGSRLTRRFDPSETSEVRIYAHAGADTVLAKGPPTRVLVRVIGGGGEDVLVRRGGPRVQFFQGGKDWRPLPNEGDQPPPRDWGGRTVSLPVLRASSDNGLTFGVKLTHVDYGFRRLPFARHTVVEGVFATATSRPGLYLTSVLQSAAPSLRFTLTAAATGAEVLRFYTAGNASIEADDRRDHYVANWQVTLSPAVELAPSGDLVLGVGPRLRFVDSELDSERLIGAVRPYGGGSFGFVGLRGYARWDTRDLPTNPRRGFLLEVGAGLVPRVWDAEDGFQQVQAAAAAYLSPLPGLSPTLALRAGGVRVWGRYPYFEAARIGGEGTIRGYSEGRFLGDAALFGSAELRVPVAQATLLVPGRLGLLGFSDAGRVFLVEGEASRDWHESVGLGLWFTPLGPANLVALTVARSPERTTVGLRGRAAF